MKWFKLFTLATIRFDIIWLQSQGFFKLVFCVFPEKLLSQTIFEWLHCYAVTLAKKFNKPLLQKREIKIFKLKWFHKKLIQIQREKNSSFLRLNQIMYKLLTISTCL